MLLLPFQNDASEAQLENRKLNIVIKSKDEEIARLQKQSFVSILCNSIARAHAWFPWILLYLLTN